MLVGWLQRLADIGRTQFEIAALEIEQERRRLVRMGLRTGAAFFLLLVGTLLALAAFLLWLEPGQRAGAALALALLFLLAAAGFACSGLRSGQGKGAATPGLGDLAWLAAAAWALWRRGAAPQPSRMRSSTSIKR